MDAEFNQQLEIERILGGAKEVLDIQYRNIGDEEARSLSTALMNENNKVTTLNLRNNKFGRRGVQYLSTALMNENNKVDTVDLSNNHVGNDGVKYLSMALIHENNKVITVNLSLNSIGDDGARSLSTALTNKKNKVITLDLSFNNIETQGLAALLKCLRVSLVNDLVITMPRVLNPEVRNVVDRSIVDFNKYVPRLVCLASVRTIQRIGVRSYLRILSSDVLIRIAQMLGWFIDLNETIRTLEEHEGVRTRRRFCSERGELKRPL